MDYAQELDAQLRRLRASAVHLQEKAQEGTESIAMLLLPLSQLMQTIKIYAPNVRWNAALVLLEEGNTRLEQGIEEKLQQQLALAEVGVLTLMCASGIEATRKLDEGYLPWDAKASFEAFETFLLGTDWGAMAKERGKEFAVAGLVDALYALTEGKAEAGFSALLAALFAQVPGSQKVASDIQKLTALLMQMGCDAMGSALRENVLAELRAIRPLLIEKQQSDTAKARVCLYVLCLLLCLDERKFTSK